MTGVDDMPAAHREYIVALADGTIAGYGIADAVWREVDPWPTARRDLDTQCPLCTNERINERDARLHKPGTARPKRRAAPHSAASIEAAYASRRRVWVRYLRLPPAIAAAAPTPKQRQTVGYWLGQCRECRTVYWAVDDGAQPIKPKAEHA